MRLSRVVFTLGLMTAVGCGRPDAPGQSTAAVPDEVAALFAARDRAHAAALAVIHRSPRIDGAAFNPAALMRAADALRPLGKDIVLDVLAAYGDVARAHPGRYDLDEQRSLLLVRELCEPAEPGVPLPPVAIGQPSVSLPAGFTAWPLFPLVEQDGVPFLVVSGYAIAGKPESSRVHLDDCRNHGRLRARPAKPAAFAAAADALILSPAWREVMHGDDAAAMVRKQAERAARP